MNRLTDIVQQSNGGNTVGAKHVTIGYNALGQRTSLNRYESLGTTNLVATTNWGYDTANRLSLIEHKRNSTTFASYAYSYDGLSRITSINSLVDGVSNFSYDPTSQLTAADHSSQTDENYGYDLNGNRNTSGFTTGQNNQTLAGDGFTYTYDNEGNRTSRTETATGKVQEYVWDHRNRLTRIQFKDNAGIVTKQLDYTYDVFNRRTSKSYDADGAGSGVAVKNWFVYQGDDIVASTSSSGVIQHRFLHGPAVDQVLADEDVGSGNILWALADHLGSVRDVVNDSGAVTNHLLFDSYGNVTSETNVAVDFLFGFTGREREEESGLNYHRARYYNPGIGRWISEDPIGFAGGDYNIQRYTRNDPVNLRDPSGLYDEMGVNAPGASAQFWNVVRSGDSLAIENSRTLDWWHISPYIPAPASQDTVMGPTVWLYTGNFFEDEGVYNGMIGEIGADCRKNLDKTYERLDTLGAVDPTNMTGSVKAALLVLEERYTEAAGEMVGIVPGPNVFRGLRNAPGPGTNNVALNLQHRANKIDNAPSIGSDDLVKASPPRCGPGDPNCFTAGHWIVVSEEPNMLMAGLPMEMNASGALTESVDRTGWNEAVVIVVAAGVIALLPTGHKRSRIEHDQDEERAIWRFMAIPE